MRRHSIKKASSFKLQGERNKFQSYLQDIQNCQMAKKYPRLIESIRQTSETVYNYCFTFIENSPFCKGLNYGCKSIGFSFEDNVLHYKEWLPNIDSAFIMGEFNGFNRNSHKLEKSQEDGTHWYRFQLDLSGLHIQDNGSKFMLRIIDHQGTQFYMIPPSCHIISNGYGIVKKTQILPVNKKKHKINQLLAYTLDLSRNTLKQCLDFLQKQSEILQAYNTIILKNLFKNNYGLMYKYSIEFKDLQLLRDIVLKIKNQCGCKVVIEWNFEPGKMQYSQNPVEKKFMTHLQQAKCTFDFSRTQVIAYYLANASYFYQNLGIDGIHFTNIGHVLKTKQGAIALKCLNVLNSRVMDSGITLGSSTENIEALTGQIIDGGYGLDFTYNHHESLALSSKHQTLYETVTKISGQSNCLAINLNDFDDSHMLNLIFAIFLSNKGIFTRGDFSHIKNNLKKILKLRCQDKLFDNEVSKIKFMMNDEVVLIQRGISVILFNFGEDQHVVQIDNCDKMQIIFTHNFENDQVSDSKVRIVGRSCILFQNESAN